jgi:uncharacterized protein
MSVSPAPGAAAICSGSFFGRAVLRGTIIIVEAVSRAVVTPPAAEPIERLKPEHGDVLFHQSGGCRDDSAPISFPAAGFMVGNSSVKLGSIAGVPSYISESQFEW